MNGRQVGVAGLPLLALALAAPLGAQDVLRWNEFEDCAGCALALRLVLRLGTISGPGVVESEHAELVSTDGKGFLLYLPRVGVNVSLFDEDGEFVRTLGRGGEGPGEFKGIHQPAFGEEDGVFILDVGGKWVELGARGQLLSERSYEGPGGPFHIEPGDTTAVVFGLQRTPDAAGYPLHRVDLRTGRVVDRFGSRDASSWKIDDFFNHRVLAGKSDRMASSVWWGSMGRAHIEEWALDGTPRRMLTGELEWLQRERGASGGGPRPLVAEFGVDRLERLWLLTLVPDRRWREVPRGGEGAVAREDYDRYWDTRLDVFDLKGERHLGSHTFDAMAVKLLRRDGQLFVYLTEFETPVWPRMAVYAVDLSDSGGS